MCAGCVADVRRTPTDSERGARERDRAGASVAGRVLLGVARTAVVRRAALRVRRGVVRKPLGVRLEADLVRQGLHLGLHLLTADGRLQLLARLLERGSVFATEALRIAFVRLAQLVFAHVDVRGDLLLQKRDRL